MLVNQTNIGMNSIVMISAERSHFYSHSIVDGGLDEMS